MYILQPIGGAKHLVRISFLFTLTVIYRTIVSLPLGKRRRGPKILGRKWTLFLLVTLNLTVSESGFQWNSYQQGHVLGFEKPQYPTRKVLLTAIQITLPAKDVIRPSGIYWERHRKTSGVFVFISWRLKRRLM